MRSVDVLWLVEHHARELDVAAACVSRLRSRHGVRAEIRHVYRDAAELLQQVTPRLVVHPFFYFVLGALATEDYVRRWPDATHLNLAWEQIHYPAHQATKAPADRFTRERVLHHAWGDFYRRYLVAHGVPEGNVFVNGNPAYGLYQEPYRRHFPPRAELAAAFGLDPDARWLFVPENYRWAFVSDQRVATLERWGAEPGQVREMREFSRESLRRVLGWCNETARRPGVELVFRTRPSTSARLMRQFFESAVETPAERLRWIKEGSVREWILASDVVLSSYSTSLIEAAIAGRPAYMLEPLPIPKALECEWYALVPRLRSGEELDEVALGERAEASQLADWARGEMLSGGDPIGSLADHVAGLLRARSAPEARERLGPLPDDVAGRSYFNPATHDQDLLDPAGVERLVARWDALLLQAEDPPGVINKTMDRRDLMSPEGVREAQRIDALVRGLYRRGLAPSSWVGKLPPASRGIRGLLSRLRARRPGLEDPASHGMDQRLDYQPLPGAADDARIPWFLYWEIHWVLRMTRPWLRPGMRLLDAGGASSVFSCYLASLGFEVDSVDLDRNLVANANQMARRMGWRSRAHAMNLADLAFPDACFDHAYSLCVFEHLDLPVKRAALAEIARCLRPGGLLALTFDYRNPAPGVKGFGKDTRPHNRLSSPDDLARAFLDVPELERVGNEKFHDSAESYLVHRRFDDAPYTFGALFLRRRSR